jgi:glycosyltransferase involved in cell wall biosynthesis
MFISPSQYFKDLIVAKTGIPADKIEVIPSGLDSDSDQIAERESSTPVLGYFSRLSYLNGLDKLVDAFILLKKSEKIPGLQLHLCGGYTGDDKSFIKEQFRKITSNNLDSDVKIYSAFSGKQKEEFFRTVDIMSVPVRKHDAYGLYILEANLAGVPVIQPGTGAFPEMVERTKGGFVYNPDTVDELAKTITLALADMKKLEKVRKQGFDAVKTKLSTSDMAKQVHALYEKVRG